MSRGEETSQVVICDVRSRVGRLLWKEGNVGSSPTHHTILHKNFLKHLTNLENFGIIHIVKVSDNND